MSEAGVIAVGEQRLLETSRGTIAIRVAGNGPRLLQVHGVGTGHRNFDLLTPLLATNFEVFDIDLPGYGDSSPVEHARDPGSYAADTAAVIEALGYGPIHVHGTSMGGRIALALAAEHPALIQRLIISLAIARLDRAAHLMRQTWITAARNGGVEAFVELVTLQGFSRAFWDRDDTNQVMAAFERSFQPGSLESFGKDVKGTSQGVDLSDVLPGIKAETLLIGADEDIMNPVNPSASGAGFEQMLKMIPNAESRVLAGGHFLLYEQPALVAREMSEYLSAKRQTNKQRRHHNHSSGQFWGQFWGHNT